MKENRSFSKMSIQVNSLRFVHRERLDLAKVSTYWLLEILGQIKAKRNALAQTKSKSYDISQ